MGRLFDQAEMTRILLRVRDAHRLAVGYDPAGNAALQGYNQAAHERFIQIGRDLEVQLAGSIVIQQDRSCLRAGNIHRGPNDTVEQDVQVEGRGQVTGDVYQPPVTFQSFFGISHGSSPSYHHVKRILRSTG